MKSPIGGFFYAGRYLDVLVFNPVGRTNRRLAIFVENSVVSYPFKGKFYKEKKKAKIKRE